MYLFHATACVQPGKNELFTRLHAQVSAAIRLAPGFVRRILLHDAEHPDTFFYISMWQSFADLQAYRDSEGGRAWSAELVAADVLAGSSARVECNLILDDMADPRMSTLLAGAQPPPQGG